MNKHSSGLRFESREIAVILSLFILVSLLMFTVGVVVGKGLAQAKFEGSLHVAEAESHNRGPSSEAHSAPAHQPALGTSVSANPPIVPPAPKLEDEPLHLEDKPLELKPKKTASLDVHQETPSDEENLETSNLLKNPKLKELFESENKPVAPKKVIAKRNMGSEEVIEGDFTQPQENRMVASVKEKSAPISFPSGPYSVQVAAYSEESQAKDRVEALKNLGFPHAYFSAINLGENKETWFRVWLGYYPSFESAKQGGETLQARGEVKNFLVRKSESSHP